MSDLQILQNQINYRFRNLELLQLALTHPSVAHELGAALQHNQRLEFLGDAVLQLVLTRDLYEKFPQCSEGPLTKARAHMVNRRTLAEQARRLHLGDYLMLSRGEELNGGRERSSALADAFEALVGAIYLDGGLEVAQEFIIKHFWEQFGPLGVIPNLENPKGELQEILQAESTEAAEYRVESVTGPDHDRLFICAVYHQGVELGRGTGKSKKMAQSQAALAALKTLHAQGRRSTSPETGGDKRA